MLLYPHSFSQSLGFNGTFDLMWLLLWSRGLPACGPASGQVKVEKPHSHQAWGVTIFPWKGFAVLFTCNFTSHFLFEQSKQKWLREWEIKGHFSGSTKGRPPLGVKAQKDSILHTSGRQKDHSGMIAQQSTTDTFTAQAQEQQKLSCLQAGIKWSNHHEGVSD